MNFRSRIKPAAKQSKFQLTEQGFVVWCGSMTKHHEVYYLYFSFWPMDKGHDAWVTRSQIGYATAHSPYGPFEYSGIALSGAGGDSWDRDCVHNPVVLKHNGKFYLYYMGNFGNGEYWCHRNNQRIGVAVADNPQGPFKRFDKPAIDVTKGSHDSLMTSNPTVCVGGDGKIYMMYKAVFDNGIMPKGGAVVCGIAVADDPLGPFIKHTKPIFQNPENDWSVEDPCIWFENGRFYALAKDFQGYFTKNQKESVALFTSKDGIEWIGAETPLAFKREILWSDGSVQQLQKMERPQVFIDDSGKAAALCCACCDIDDIERIYAYNVQIPLE